MKVSFKCLCSYCKAALRSKHGGEWVKAAKRANRRTNKQAIAQGKETQDRVSFRYMEMVPVNMPPLTDAFCRHWLGC